MLPIEEKLKQDIRRRINSQARSARNRRRTNKSKQTLEQSMWPRGGCENWMELTIYPRLWVYGGQVRSF